MNEELDSQLSAMFDDELPAAECELLARRLSRDEQLKARWGRYAVIASVTRRASPSAPSASPTTTITSPGRALSSAEASSSSG